MNQVQENKQYELPVGVTLPDIPNGIIFMVFNGIAIFLVCVIFPVTTDMWGSAFVLIALSLVMMLLSKRFKSAYYTQKAMTTYRKGQFEESYRYCNKALDNNQDNRSAIILRENIEHRSINNFSKKDAKIILVKKELVVADFFYVFINAVFNSNLPNLTKEQAYYKLTSSDLRDIDECVYYVRLSTILLYTLMTGIDDTLDTMNRVIQSFSNLLISKCSEFNYTEEECLSIVYKVNEITGPCTLIDNYIVRGNPKYFLNEEFISKLCNAYANDVFPEEKSLRREVLNEFLKDNIEMLAKEMDKYIVKYIF